MMPQNCYQQDILVDENRQEEYYDSKMEVTDGNYGETVQEHAKENNLLEIQSGNFSGLTY